MPFGRSHGPLQSDVRASRSAHLTDRVASVDLWAERVRVLAVLMALNTDTAIARDSAAGCAALPPSRFEATELQAPFRGHLKGPGVTASRETRAPNELFSGRTVGPHHQSVATPVARPQSRR